MTQCRNSIQGKTLLTDELGESTPGCVLHLHLGHLSDAFIHSDLQKVHLLKERQQYITVVPEDKNRAGLEQSYLRDE